MARGFESKAVADQQESARTAKPRARDEGALDPAVLARKRQLELARTDVLHRLAAGPVEAHRKMLERALKALEDELARIP